MLRFDTVLLDADGTLFDFDDSERRALAETLTAFSVDFSESVLSCYKQINKQCWSAFERGELQKETMLVVRFSRLLQALGKEGDPAALNDAYLTALSHYGALLPNAQELCKALWEEGCHLYIATNGVQRVQQGRFTPSPIAKYIEKVFISETIGFGKPQKEYFDAVFSALPEAKKDSSIILGDSLSSDILGGKNAGITTCWIAPEEAIGEGFDYRISSLLEFMPIVIG